MPAFNWIIVDRRTGFVVARHMTNGGVPDYGREFRTLRVRPDEWAAISNTKEWDVLDESRVPPPDRTPEKDIEENANRTIVKGPSRDEVSFVRRRARVLLGLSESMTVEKTPV